MMTAIDVSIHDQTFRETKGTFKVPWRQPVPRCTRTQDRYGSGSIFMPSGFRAANSISFPANTSILRHEAVDEPKATKNAGNVEKAIQWVAPECLALENRKNSGDSTVRIHGSPPGAARSISIFIMEMIFVGTEKGFPGRPLSTADDRRIRTPLWLPALRLAMN